MSGNHVDKVLPNLKIALQSSGSNRFLLKTSYFICFYCHFSFLFHFFFGSL